MKFCQHTIDLYIDPYPDRLGIRNCCFLKGTRLSAWQKKPRSREEIWTHIIFYVVSWNRTCLGSERFHHCTIPPQKPLTLLNKQIIQFKVVMKTTCANFGIEKSIFSLPLQASRLFCCIECSEKLGAWWRASKLLTKPLIFDSAAYNRRVCGIWFPKTVVYAIFLLKYSGAEDMFFEPRTGVC